MPIYSFRDQTPRIDPTAFIHPDAVIIGDVEIGAASSVWPGVVIRGDVHFIRIGQNVNIQDGSILHVSRPTPEHPEGMPLILEDNVTIGHRVVLHGCHLQSGCLIGMGAIVLDGVVVESNSMVAAAALVPPGKIIAAQTLWRGSPATFARSLADTELVAMQKTAFHYNQLATEHRIALQLDKKM